MNSSDINQYQGGTGLELLMLMNSEEYFAYGRGSVGVLALQKLAYKSLD